MTWVDNVVNGDHALAGRVKGDFLLARIILIDHVSGSASFQSCHQDGTFGWVANHTIGCFAFALANRLKLRVVVDGANPQGGSDSREPLEVSDNFPINREVANWFIPGAADVHELTIHPELGDGHLVLGERSSLVGANGSDGAKGLDRCQLTDQRVAVDHFAHTTSQADGDHGGQTFGHGSDCQGDSYHEQGNDLIPEGFGAQVKVAGHSQANDTDHEYQHTNNHGGDAKGFAKLFKAFLQRGLLFFHRLEHCGDQTELRVHTGGDDHAFAAPVTNGGSQEGSVLTVSQGNVRLQV